ncbi:MAG: MBL fold metallo-hydrolase [Trueperaceae bacterium]
MPTVHLLGTGSVSSDPHRTTTMLALDNGFTPLWIDCGADALPRLEAVGLDPLRLGALIVTHEHADHVSGFPLLLERLWLLGRREPLPVYGIAPALAQVHRTHDAFDVSGWDGYPGWTPHEIPYALQAPVGHQDGWRITASPGRHAVPVVGLRFRDLTSGRDCTYSSDTAPTAAITDLARDSDLLVHEATGAGPCHASAVQAARIARASDPTLHIEAGEELAGYAF